MPTEGKESIFTIWGISMTSWRIWNRTTRFVSFSCLHNNCLF